VGERKAEMVQWCHGAPGFIPTLVKASKVADCVVLTSNSSFFVPDISQRKVSASSSVCQWCCMEEGVTEKGSEFVV
jgi:hypothetical protein